ncbi:aminotransferase class I/II-fold pyridoxal phosphate-dependent enzyme [Galactobacter caseinivorans]|uniref:Amino acid decarboxylase n=1 Tax=Galactobacter caseinivorans TaxID=2676123 RepID=A0A496PI35_9MICC|nr:aminotransferase class V-fold PLP-dependent enzyme [Galactobacter caseinivorans]RKW70156.1 amino acid decarboxylase [Galactobacter caseinivorans]
MPEKNSAPLDQDATPYASALRRLGDVDFMHLDVPSHQGRAANAPGLADLVGERILRLDKSTLFSDINQDTWAMDAPPEGAPLEQAQRLAAEAWGASRLWFLGNGASSGNHIATMVARALGRETAVQRSVHSSVIDGMIHAGLEPHFIFGSVDRDLGSSHGVTAAQVEHVLTEHPGVAAVQIVSPSYFGAVSDVAAIAEVAHAHGKPLIVDEAWGSHFGFSEGLPGNAVRLGADLVVSSSHKNAGALTQAAMLMLGHGEFAEALEDVVDRVHRSYMSTSTSALLLGSLDEARRRMAVDGPVVIPQTLAAVRQLRAEIADRGRFRDATDDAMMYKDVVGQDPFKVVIDTRTGGLSGTEAHYLLTRDHRVVVELSTHAVIVLLIGATSVLDVDRFIEALYALPKVPESLQAAPALPQSAKRARRLQEAFFSPTELVGWEDAVGRISADALSAYPPGIPNILPGEVFTEEMIQFLRKTAAMPAGHVRGAADEHLDRFRVVVVQPPAIV